MPTPPNNEILPGALDTLGELERAEGNVNLTAEQLQRLSKSVNALYVQGTPVEQKTMRARLSALQTRINGLQAAEVDTKAALEDLRGELRFARLYDPETGEVNVQGAGKAAVDTYRSVEDVASKAAEESLNMNRDAARWVVRGGVLLAGVAVARWMWNGMGSFFRWVTGTAVAIGGGIAAFSWIPEGTRNSIRDWFYNTMPTAITSWFPREGTEKVTKEGEAKGKENAEKTKKDAEAKANLDKETKEKSEKQKVLNETTQEITKELGRLPRGPLLRTPSTIMRIRGMEVTLGPDAIFVNRNGQRFRAEIIATAQDDTTHPLNSADLSVGYMNIGFNRTPDSLRNADSVQNVLLTTGLPGGLLAPSLAQGFIAFQSGSNSFTSGRLRINLIPA